MKAKVVVITNTTNPGALIVNTCAVTEEAVRQAKQRIGKPKVESAKQTLQALNPDVNNATHWFGVTLPALSSPPAMNSSTE